jgi:hypothetical protein
VGRAGILGELEETSFGEGELERWGRAWSLGNGSRFSFAMRLLSSVRSSVCYEVSVLEARDWGL